MAPTNNLIGSPEERSGDQETVNIEAELRTECKYTAAEPETADAKAEEEGSSLRNTKKSMMGNWLELS